MDLSLRLLKNVFEFPQNLYGEIFDVILKLLVKVNDDNLLGFLLEYIWQYMHLFNKNIKPKIFYVVRDNLNSIKDKDIIFDISKNILRYILWYNKSIMIEVVKLLENMRKK